MGKRRYRLRRLRWRLARLAALGKRTKAGMIVWPALILLLAGAAYVSLAETPALQNHWVGWRERIREVTQLAFQVDAKRGIELLRSTLPIYESGRLGPEPPDSWRIPLRAWVHLVTGYDFTSPRSFLEAEVAGFRAAVGRGLDVAVLPEGRSETPPPAGQGDVGGSADATNLSGVEPRTRQPIEPEPDESTTRAEPGPISPASAPPQLAALTETSWGRDPLVLILHSHTSESYRTIPPDPRATDQLHVHNSTDTGIVRVGRALADKLRDAYNIPSIHSTRIHNWPHHVRAYLNSRETVLDILRQYPSIQVVLDLHRQGVPNFYYATSVGEFDAVGIDVLYTTGIRASYPNPHWQENEAFARRLAEAMNDVHPGLLRRVMRVDDSVYNQDLHPRMLLLEVGNYLDLEERAVAAAQLVADALALVLDEIVRTEVDRAAPAVGRRVTPPAPVTPVPRERPL